MGVGGWERWAVTEPLQWKASSRVETRPRAITGMLQRERADSKMPSEGKELLGEEKMRGNACWGEGLRDENS